MVQSVLSFSIYCRITRFSSSTSRGFATWALDRARNDMDDLYLLNPDTVLALGSEGKLADLSGLDSVPPPRSDGSRFWCPSPQPDASSSAADSRAAARPRRPPGP